jgi:hypothetical protein
MWRRVFLDRDGRYKVGQRSCNNVTCTLVARSLLIFVQSNVNWKTNVCHFWGTLQRSDSKTSPVRYRPSRSMHWWAPIIMLPVTRTLQVIWHFFVQTHRSFRIVSVCHNVFFKLPRTKESQADRSGERAGRKMSLFLEKSERRMHCGIRPRIYVVIKWRL